MDIFDLIEDFVEDPWGTAVEVAIQPAVDALDILDGLTEGEIRERAVIRLGTDVVAGMALGEIIEHLRK